ncbi:MAG: site-2 protease family protein [Patescibacteria group bacterium]|mgnify:CR=1 FL=1
MTIILVLLSISILIFFHELGHFLFAKFFKMPVEEFCIGFPPRLWKKRVGETLYSVGTLPFGGFVKITGENGDDDEAQSAQNFSTHPFHEKSIVILAGVAFNILLGWFALVLLFTTGIPKHLFVNGVSKDSPASEAGIKAGDVILKATTGSETLEAPIALQAFMNLTSAHEGKYITLEILRGKRRTEKNVLIRKNAAESEGRVGVHLTEIGEAPRPFPKNITEGTATAFGTLSRIARSFVDFVTHGVTRSEVAEDVTGPIGIVGIAIRAGNLGLPYLVELMAIISLNLAVLNFIPFPALDGGRFLFLCIEKIIRRPLSLKTQNIANAAGFAILILLMVLVTIKDISRVAL